MSQEQVVKHSLKTFFCYRCCHYRPKDQLAPPRTYSTLPTCITCDVEVHKHRTLIGRKSQAKHYSNGHNGRYFARLK